MKETQIEVCIGVGMDQIFPEIVKISIPINFDPENAWERVPQMEESNKD